MKKTLSEHFDPKTSGPKRILSLDGGGIRGALTLGYLKKIETILRKKENDPNLLLCDYFDLIGGTSTGSIIASALAIGKSVDEFVDLYMDLGGKIFGKKNDWWNPLDAAGFVVDDAIVMIENIARYIEEGGQPLAAALKGAKQIGFTIISLTLSLIAVLIPLLFMQDVVGRLFHEFAVTLAAANLLSAFVSLTFTPMLCARILQPSRRLVLSVQRSPTIRA